MVMKNITLKALTLLFLLATIFGCQKKEEAIRTVPNNETQLSIEMSEPVGYLNNYLDNNSRFFESFSNLPLYDYKIMPHLTRVYGDDIPDYYYYASSIQLQIDLSRFRFYKPTIQIIDDDHVIFAYRVEKLGEVYAYNVVFSRSESDESESWSTSEVYLCHKKHLFSDYQDLKAGDSIPFAVLKEWGLLVENTIDASEYGLPEGSEYDKPFTFDGSYGLRDIANGQSYYLIPLADGFLLIGFNGNGYCDESDELTIQSIQFFQNGTISFDRFFLNDTSLLVWP